MTAFEDHVGVLERLYVIEDIRCPVCRHSVGYGENSKKRSFVDPSIAVAAIGASPDSLELDFQTFGFIFECMCIRNLKVYSQALGGKVSYYHGHYGLEADIVLHSDDGRYAPIECKLGSRDIEEKGQRLIINHTADPTEKRDGKADTSARARPAVVLTSSELAYTREDGMRGTPLGHLKD